jgi:MotA/TolQ/ExbB proton channel family
MGIRRRALFLKWCVINLIATTISTVAIVLARNQLQSISVVTLVMAAAIGIVYAFTTIYAGIVSWNTDLAIEGGNEALALKIARHASSQISFSANLCPYIGLLGAVVGIFVTLSTKLEGVSDAEHIKTAVSMSISGMGIAFIPTILGIYACLVLIVEHNVVEHAIDEPKPEKGWT